MNSTVGCGIIFATQEVFFVVDGNFNGIAFKNVDTSEIYPTASLHSPNEEVRLNLGQEPFKFDLESMIVVISQEETLKDLRKIFDEPIVSIDVHKLVLEYLNHYAYLSTLESFVQESGISRIEESLQKIKAKDVQTEEPVVLKKHERQYCTFSPLLFYFAKGKQERKFAFFILTFI